MNRFPRTNNLTSWTIASLIASLFFLSSCRKDKAASINDSPVQEVTTSITPTTLTEPTSTVQSNNSPKEGMDIGNIAWDLNLHDSNGVFTKLSSLRGRLILLDFWASWCKPCKIENSKLKSVYNKYKDTTFKMCQGFEIYMVSIDERKDGWMYELRRQNYNWKYNLWDEGAGAQWRYNVTSIPRNLLLDSKGVIIAKDLRDSLVEKALIALLK